MSHNNEDYVKSELYRIRHSTAHIMAEAVLEMFPDCAKSPSALPSRTVSTTISTCPAPSPLRTSRSSKNA